MTDFIKPPAPTPCGSCPYRRDVPSGIWAREEYEKLPRFDGETWEQDATVFLCHRQDGRLCAGWVGVHDMVESLGLRLAVAGGRIHPAVAGALPEYATETPLFASGAEAGEHGLRDLEQPGDAARRLITRLGQP